jgi:hypothetical protein
MGAFSTFKPHFRSNLLTDKLEVLLAVFLEFTKNFLKISQCTLLLPLDQRNTANILDRLKTLV